MIDSNDDVQMIMDVLWRCIVQVGVSQREGTAKVALCFNISPWSAPHYGT